MQTERVILIGNSSLGLNFFRIFVKRFLFNVFQLYLTFFILGINVCYIYEIKWNKTTYYIPGMLILVLVLVIVLKDSLKTFSKSLSLSWSLEVRSFSLSWSLGVRSLSLSWSLWSSPCPCPCPWFQSLQGLVSIIVLFRFIRIILYCSINAYNQF